MSGGAVDFPTLDALTGGKLGTFDVPCPSCGPERRSPANRVAKKLRIWRAEPAFARFHCARCSLGGCERSGFGHSSIQPVPAACPAETRTDAERTAYALDIWRQAVDPLETPVIPYLAARGLTLPQEAAGEALRWHAHCPFGKGVRTGCMVALVRDIRTDEPVAIHRTAITPDGRKATIGGVSRLSLGPIGGGAVKLTPDADVTLGLGVGEGVETVLSLRRLAGCHALAVWALLAANQLSAMPVLSGLDGLWIAVDHDPTGLAAAQTLRERWQDAGVEVVTARPETDGADLNDVARARHAH